MKFYFVNLLTCFLSLIISNNGTGQFLLSTSSSLGAVIPSPVTASSGCTQSIRLNNGSIGGFQAASSWELTKRLDFTKRFRVEFDIRFGNKNSADGITFTIQTTGLNELKSGGGYLGVSNSWTTGIPNSIIAEFDIFDNLSTVGDIYQDHFAISVNGNISSPILPAVPISITNNNWESVEVIWDCNTLKYYLNGIFLGEINDSVVKSAFSGSLPNNAFFGFTAASANLLTTQDVCFKKVEYKDCIVNDSTIIDTTTTIEAICESILLMPNVFSPNSDGVNDVFKPIKQDCIEMILFSVYNRWGQKVFESDYSIFWDGITFNGKFVSEGDYFWVLSYQDSKNQTLFKKGHLNIFK